MANFRSFIIFILKYFRNRVIITLFAVEKNNIIISITMNVLIKYLGVIVLLIGVAILAVPTITGGLNNSILIVGLSTIILGYLGHIFLNKKVG